MNPRSLSVAFVFLAVMAFTVPRPHEASSTQVVITGTPIVHEHPLIAQSVSEPIVVEVTTTTTVPEPPPTTEVHRPAPPEPPPVTEPAPEPVVVEAAAAPPSDGSVEGAVRDWFPDNFDSAWRVSGCESGHDPSAVSPGGGNWGLFQINTVHKKDFERVTGHPWSDVLDPYLNAQYAKKLYDGSGWGPWTCRWAA